MKSFYVINEEWNHKRFTPYDVMPYLIDRYKESRNKPKTLEEFCKFVKGESQYQWWSRCEYEIIIADWPSETFKEKWDIHKQLMMNLETVAELLMQNVAEL